MALRPFRTPILSAILLTSLTTSANNWQENGAMPLYEVNNLASIEADQRVSIQSFQSMLQDLPKGARVALPLPGGRHFSGQVTEQRGWVRGVSTTIIEGENGTVILNRSGQRLRAKMIINGEGWLLSISEKGSSIKKQNYLAPTRDGRDVLNLAPATNELSTGEPTLNGDTPVVDLYVLLDSRGNQEYGNVELILAEFVASTNLALRQSGVNLEYNVLRSDQVSLPENARLIDTLFNTQSDPAYESYRRVAKEIGADLMTTLMVRSDIEVGCGVAQGGGFDGVFSGNLLHSVAAYGCWFDTFAHELGHNLGLAHSRAANEVGYSAPYALGHGVVNRFHTIMAYPSSYYQGDYPAAALLFSNPDLMCGDYPCGIAHENESTESADAARALNEVANAASAIRTRTSDDISALFSEVSELPNELTSAIEHPGDIDGFYLAIENPQHVRVDFNQEMDVRVYSEDGTRLWREKTDVMELGLVEGKYFLELRAATLLGTGKYQLSSSLSALTEKATTSIALEGIGGVSLIKETLSGAGCEFVNGICALETYQGMPLQLVVVADELSEFDRFSTCDASQPYGCNFMAGDAIGVKVKLGPYSDLAGTVARPRAMELDEFNNEVIAHRYDVDVYTYVINEPGFYYLWFGASDKVTVELFNRKMELLNSRKDFSDTSDGAISHRWRLGWLEQGRYFLKVSPNENMQGFERFHFVVSDKPDPVTVEIEMDKGENQFASANAWPFYKTNYGDKSLTLKVAPGSLVTASGGNYGGHYSRLTECSSTYGLLCSYTVVDQDLVLDLETFVDSDGDGLPDYLYEQYPDLGSADDDYDDDRVVNYYEFQLHMDLNSSDSDGDGMSDERETTRNLAPTDPTDADRDNDNDWLSNYEEVVIYGTDPTLGGNLGSRSSLQYAVNGGLIWNGPPTPNDYDGDIKADHAFYDPETGFYYIESTGLSRNIKVDTGVINGVPVPGDYDGDGLTDVAVMDPKKGTWFIRYSMTAKETTIWLGTREEDIPIAGDFDGDGIDDPTIRRPSEGFWAIQRSSDAVREFVYFGKQATDIPLAADMNGDGYDDFIIRRPTTGDWYVKDAVSGDITQWFLGREQGDIPFVMDYNGDGINEFAIRRPSNRNWFIKELATNNVTEIEFGQQVSDVPAIYDVDGDGRDDLVIRRANESRFYWRPVFDYNGVDYSYFGKKDRYIPAAAPLIYRMPSVPWAKSDASAEELIR